MEIVEPNKARSNPSSKLRNVGFCNNLRRLLLGSGTFRLTINFHLYIYNIICICPAIFQVYINKRDNKYYGRCLR